MTFKYITGSLLVGWCKRLGHASLVAVRVALSTSKRADSYSTVVAILASHVS